MAIVMGPSDDALTLLAGMRQAYANAGSVQFEGKYETTNGPYELKAEYDTTRRRFWSELTPDGQSRPSRAVYADGGQVHVAVQGRELQVFGQESESVSRHMGGNLEAICFIDWHKQLNAYPGGNMHQNGLSVRTTEWSGSQWQVLEERIPWQGVKINYFVHPETKFIGRTIVWGRTGRVLSDCQVTKLEVGNPLTEARFAVPKKIKSYTNRQEIRI